MLGFMNFELVLGASHVNRLGLVPDDLGRVLSSVSFLGSYNHNYTFNLVPRS